MHWALASALAGGLVGAGLVIALTQNEAARTPVAPAGTLSDARFYLELTRRLDAIERSLRLLEARSTEPGTPRVALAAAGSSASAAPSLETAQAAVHGPAFEAAVLDVLERAEQSRDTEPEVKREGKERVRTEAWANELTMRLGLSPAQSARLLEIQTQLTTDLRSSRARVPEGQPSPTDKGRAATLELRQRAEKQLRDVLDARQLAAYDELKRVL